MSISELSIGELDALTLKACRGAGYSWGLAQEAGRAAAWLAVRGLPSADLFGMFLEQINGIEPGSLAPEGLNVAISDEASRRCPLMTGALISDHGMLIGKSVNTGPVYSPMIMLPFVASVARNSSTGLSVSIDGAEVRLNSDGELTLLPQELDQIFALSHSPFVSIGSLDDAGGVPVTVESRRATASSTRMQVLESLAHLTYVPASDQSRSGAGAGLTDND